MCVEIDEPTLTRCSKPDELQLIIWVSTLIYIYEISAIPTSIQIAPICVPLS